MGTWQDAANNVLRPVDAAIPDIKPGAVLVLHFGPFRCTGTVVKVLEQGAVVKPNNDPVWVGFKHPTIALNGHLLADEEHTFIGRAHWHDVTYQD